MSIVERRLPIPADTPHPLGRHVRHDEQSRAFPLMATLGLTVDRSTWKDKAVRLYDPTPKPNQSNGCCTACAKGMQFNAVGNRRPGVRLTMDWAQSLYHEETVIDPFPGTFPPDDTGSNGLASCKAVQAFGYGGAYYWLFGGADEVVQAIMAGKAISLGTRWDNNMFNPDSKGIIHPGGGEAGGHQWIARRYDKSSDLIGVDCWWGGWKAWMSRADVQALLDDQGDAHWQVRGLA
jgi:hypothetical protein